MMAESSRISLPHPFRAFLSLRFVQNMVSPQAQVALLPASVIEQLKDEKQYDLMDDIHSNI